jgi:hypothetical protein
MAHRGINRTIHGTKTALDIDKALGDDKMTLSSANERESDE